MTKENVLVDELVKNTLFRMDECTRMIQLSLNEITEEEFWFKPNASLNSIANLLLHLNGNITQYIISSLGENEDVRNRDLEFSVSQIASKSEVFTNLEDTLNTAKRIIFDASLDQLLKVRRVQGFTFSGIGIIIHAVEHYSYHTGQIAFFTKQLKNKDLDFYANLDLNNKNN